MCYFFHVQCHHEFNLPQCLSLSTYVPTGQKKLGLNLIALTICFNLFAKANVAILRVYIQNLKPLKIKVFQSFKSRSQNLTLNLIHFFFFWLRDRPHQPSPFVTIESVSHLHLSLGSEESKREKERKAIDFQIISQRLTFLHKGFLS